MISGDIPPDFGFGERDTLLPIRQHETREKQDAA
jgi:hypothetical protein